ncbi:tRNA-uridine aminocarboxypropyltransferase [Microbulbifer thermotolerans]|uniref:tRNA-uridine aminocarboxypropyltransferase n=1 Tax=Microbulbifer thermotolerans TaxID=252514 RepID=UPI00224AA3F2|nr:tRNA-uridine aminocarboxypropyltransferase [Microbulbifer thermotolerans]MCX2835957.1 DTW domain-containing protein [Microbulbifer thermotolerans]
MKITLLTHQRELERKTNTGALALQHCGNMVERLVWARRSPAVDLVKAIECGKAVLVYPGGESRGTQLEDFAQVILIDATWQEARKIYNHSSYLQAAPRVTLTTDTASNYRLRRNQPNGGLCTAECVIEILRRHGENSAADRLHTAFIQFNQAGYARN